MRSEHEYRLLAFAGTGGLSALALAVANHPEIQLVFTTGVPVFERLIAVSLGGTRLLVAHALVGAATVGAALPLCKPQPRRILDTVTRALRSLAAVVLVLATVGFFDRTYRVPRAPLLLTVGLLAVTLPAWFVLLQERHLKRSGRTLVVGGDPARVAAAIDAASGPIAGYTLSPTASRGADGRPVNTDGGVALPPPVSEYDCLGGLSRLDDVLRESNIGTVVPALPRTDRAEFFGVLDACHRHGVDVEVLEGDARGVLVDEGGEAADPTPDAGGPDAGPEAGGSGSPRLDRIDLEPWDLQTRVPKRLFDVAFAAVGLACTLPLLVVVAAAVKLDSRGPVLYAQERTTQFGGTFSVYKFRSMVPGDGSAVPGEEADRVTRVGRVLRRTHLDELPQLWAVFLGQMSVVGPRAAWTAEEELLRAEVPTWQKRWFVRPGLTGLAQINGLESADTREKLRHDLAYIRRQSFGFDLKIVVRQLWLVATDVSGLAVRGLRRRLAASRADDRGGGPDAESDPRRGSGSPPRAGPGPDSQEE